MEGRYPSIQRVLFVALAVNLLLATGKMLVGWGLGSLGVMSAGLYSVMDGMGSAVGLMAIHLAAMPRDPRRPHRPGRLEILGPLLLAGLMLLSCWEILGAVFTRLTRPSPLPVFSWGAVLFLLSTLGVNFWLSRYVGGKAAELDSPILAAGARHTLGDVVTTLLACVGLFAGQTRWVLLDSLCALGIVALIIRAAAGHILETVETGVDARPWEDTSGLDDPERDRDK